VLRLLGPVVVILTLMLASCVALLLVGRSWLPPLLKVHKASFLLWFGAMTIHVLGHQLSLPFWSRINPYGPASIWAPAWVWPGSPAERCEGR
jgi:hypothetical protein